MVRPKVSLQRTAKIVLKAVKESGKVEFLSTIIELSENYLSIGSYFAFHLLNSSLIHHVYPDWILHLWGT